MKQYTCEKCQNQIQIEKDTMFVSCSKCFSYYKITDRNLQFIDTFGIMRAISPDSGALFMSKTGIVNIPVCFDLEQKITLKGINYTIKGITQRNDFDYKSINWREYFLKSDLGENAFLNEYNGNWQLVKPLMNFEGKENWKLVKYEDIDYALFQKYYQDLIWAIGNFEFDITDTNKLYSREYIAPPKILINEVRKTQRQETDSEWYLGEYLEENEVFLNVNSVNTAKFPSKIGVGATQPYKANFYFSEAKNWSLMTLVALLAIQIGFLFYSPTKDVLSQTFSTNDLKYDSVSTYAVTPKPIVSKSFEIEKTSKIKINLETNVDNSWLESNITLVNEQTGDELPIVLGAEYYHGVDGGESWTEGDKSVSKDYSSVPAGKYHLLIEASSPKKEAGYYSIKLTIGGMYFLNLFAMLVLIACVPIYLYFEEREFEKRRWADSDFSPYISEEEE